VTDPETIYRFYDFEFGTRRRELRKGGHRVRISASQIRLLTLFLERHGELVTREDIAGRIWTDTATIDVANGVNTAINRLRYLLGDDSASPRFLETVIGLGYRFIAPVEVVSITEETAADAAEVPGPVDQVSESGSPLPEPIHQPSGSHSTSRQSLLWTLLSLGALATATGIVALFLHFHRKAAARAINASVAEAAFFRVTSNRGGREITAEAISPDGKLLAYADSFGIRVQTLSTQKEFSLAALPAFQVTHISWFRTQSDLAVSGLDLATHHTQVWMVPLAGVGTVMIADNADLGMVSPDGNTIAFTKAEGGEVWVAGQNGVNLRRLAAVEGNSTFSFLFWSGDSRRLMLVSHSRGGDSPSAEAINPAQPVIPDSPGEGDAQQEGHWVCESVDAVAGKLLAREENVRIRSAALLPNGRLLYVTGTAIRNSLAQGKILAVETDPATGRFLDAPVSESQYGANSISSISASGDGSTIAILSHVQTADVFTASLHRADPGSMPTLENLQPLTSELADTYPHAWAADGTVIYEVGDRGHEVIYGRLNAETSPRLLAKLPVTAAMAQLTPDGHWVVFLGIEGGSASVYRVPAGGGTPERIPGGESVDEVRCAVTGSIPCVLRKVESKDGVRERLYFALDPISGVGKLLARTPWEPSRRGDWGLSPDGSRAVVANHDTLHPALNFLKLNGASAYEKTEPLLGHGAPLGASWTQDGKDLFVETRTGSDLELLYLSHDGRVKVLHKSPSVIWAVPSPDGSRVAFPEYITNSNVWVSDARAEKH
jgi:DNA-binding winged helix-turn-helix (wHTH) protein/Tol biopolymer transport system component